MKENTVLELARSLQNTNTAQRETADFLQLMRQHLEQDSLQKIRSAASLQKCDAVEHPPREVTLLRALSAFTDERGKRQLDTACRSLLFCHTLQQIQQNIASCTQDGAFLETRSQSDGTCQPTPDTIRMAGLCMALSLLDSF